MRKSTGHVTPRSDPSPLAKHRAEVEARILAEAERIFIEDGEAGLSIRRLADAVDLSPAAIYRYFNSKDEVILALRNAFFSTFLLRLDRVTRTIDNPLEALRVGLTAYIEMALEKPHHYRAAFTIDSSRTNGAESHKDGDISQKPNLLAFQQLLERLSQLAAQGDEVPSDVETVARSLWASIHGLALLMIVFPHWPRSNRNEMISAHVEQIIRGLSPASVQTD